MVPDSLFNDDDDSILPRDVIIKRFQEWWTIEQIEEILKDRLISSPAFLENIKHQESDEFKLDHLQYATILYEQVGEKFLFEKNKDRRYRFLSKVLKAVTTEQPSIEKEINRMFVKYWPWVKDIPPYSDVRERQTTLEDYLHELRSMTSKKTFLKELVEIINLPPVCAQRGEKGIDRKTETIDPIGLLNPLYDFQNDVGYKIKDMLENYDDKTSRGIVALPTGCGKTRLVVESILEWINHGKPGQEDKKFVLWIVDRKELCDQAYDAFKMVFTAMGKQDTSLKLHVFYGDKPKNITDTLDESISESQSYTTSIIVASIGSLHNIYKNQKELPEEDRSLRDLGKTSALVVLDEAHHAIADSYTDVLNGLGFNFRANETHPAHTRLLGLTATPFRRESDSSLSAESERLRRRFGKTFLWPSLQSSTLDDEDNHPHAVMELQQSATVGMPVKVTAERSFDQDGQLREFYWQIYEVDESETHHRLYNDNIDYAGSPKKSKKKKGVCKYDTGTSKCGQEGTPTENQENWEKGDYHSDKKEVVLHVKDDVFEKAGLYEVFLWVKDDDELVCLEPDYRVIRINEKPPESVVGDQLTLKKIYEKLMKAKVLAVPTRWILEHDSQKYLDDNQIEVTYKPLFGKDSNEYSKETLQAIAEEAKLNAKILAVIRKLVEEEDKKSILLFANTVDHARLLSTLIRARLGYTAEYIFAGTHIDERCKFVRKFREKKITVLCNYDILTTGFDAPQVDAIVNTRLTGSYVLYTQMIGRGLRGPKNGGTDKCVVVDFNPKIRNRTDAMTESEKISAWRFHEDLFEESKTLTDEDLNLPEYAAKIAELDEAKKTWESDGKIVSETLSNIEKSYQIFKEYPELSQKPEYSKFLKYIQEKYVELSVKALESDDNFRIVDEDDHSKDAADELTKWHSPAASKNAPEQEPEIFEKKLSYDDLMHFINHTMRMKSNYQPMMILFLLTHPNKSATRREIAGELENRNQNWFDYEKVPVYGVLEGHNVVIREEGRSLSDDVFTLNVEDLDEEQTQTVIAALQKKTKKISDITPQIFEHICPKCNKVNVKYHKPPTEEENELIEKSFGWRGDIIQSWCRLCRSPKIENKKPGFLDRLKEKYTGGTTADAADTLKDAIVEAKQCGVCGFLAKDEDELQEHKQGKKHFTDK